MLSLNRRTLSVESPAIPQHLGAPALEPVRLSGREALNGLFEYELLLKTPDGLNLGASEAADFNLDDFIGREISCSIQLDGSGQFIPGVVGTSVDHIGSGVRQINALIADAACLGEEGRHILYTLTLRPWLYLATETTDCKVFQNKTVVDILDELLGVPAAFDVMGTYHQSGIGVIPDIDRAYAFWQLAADMGNPAAQTYLGKKLKAVYDSEQMGVWGNRKVGLKMLECAFAQGNGDAAYQLALTTQGTNAALDEDNARALLIYHEGVKLGSKDSARALSVSFGLQRPLTGNLIDRARAERYSTLFEALELNPDLRFPSLDKVLPLPPADLPYWDGKRETLINAAKTVVVKPVAQSTPGADRVGRAHIPAGHILPQRPVPPAGEALGTGADVDVRASTQAYFSGYWRPQLHAQSGEDLAEWNSAQPPQRYARGEAFDDLRKAWGLSSSDARQIEWYYAGVPVPVAAPPMHPYVAQGRARYVQGLGEPLSCSGTAPCPRTGIWSARLKEEHPQHAVFYSHWRQAYVEQDQPFPVPAALHEAGGLTVQATDLRWFWRGEANQADRSGHVHVTLG